MSDTATKGRLAIFLDTDVGSDIDDVLAILYAIKHPMLDIAGVSTVSGNTTARAILARHLLDAGGLEDTPVHAGATSKAFLSHGKRLGQYKGLPPTTGIEEMVDAAWKYIDARDSPIIVAIGPFSNIPLVRGRDPALFDDKVSIVAMGGSIHGGYVHPAIPSPEYNIISDIKAAKHVFSCDARLSIVPLDVTARLKMHGQDLKALTQKGKDDPLLALTSKMVSAFRRVHHRMPILFDPATVATLIRPDYCSFESMPLHVNKLGFTRVTKAREGSPGDASSPRPVRVCLELDAEAFMSDFLDTVAGA